VAVAVAIVALAAPFGSSVTSASSVGFEADFSTVDDMDLFDWQVFHGGIDPFPRGDQPEQWHGDHDSNCGAPTTLRDVALIGETEPGPVESAGDLVWWCAPGDDPTKGHMMTSTSLVAYGHVDFSPRRVFEEVDRVCWDQNWTEMGGRKWTQVAVVPEDTFQANGGRMEYVTQDLEADVAVNGLPITGDAWILSMLRASTKVQVGEQVTHDDYVGFQTTDKARRFKHCAIDQGDGNVRLELEREDGTDVRIAPGSFPDGPVRVIFQDATYDSIKGTLSSDAAQQTNTWHWDNVLIGAAAASETPARTAPPETSEPVAPPEASADERALEAPADQQAVAASVTVQDDDGRTGRAVAAVTLVGLVLLVAALALVALLQRAGDARRYR
jgi:hypothetical protein